MLKRAVINFGSKLFGGGVVVLLNLYVASVASPSDYGLYATIVSYCALIGGCLAFGGDHFFKKYFGEKPNAREIISLCKYLLPFVTLLSLLFSYFMPILLGESISSSSKYGWFYLLSGYIFFIAMQKNLSGALIGIGSANTEAFFFSLVRPVLFLFLLYFVIEFSNNDKRVLTYVWQAGVIAYLVTTVCMVFFVYWYGKSTYRLYSSLSNQYAGLAGIRLYLKQSGPMTVIGITGLVEKNIDTLMIAMLAGAEDAGVYYFVTRISALSTMPLYALNAINSSGISKKIEDKEYGDVRKITLKISIYSSVCVSLMLAFIVVFEEYISKYFFSIISESYVPLLILVFSYLLRSLLGPANLVAVLSGNAGYASRASTISLFINICLNLLLIPVYGIYGAIVATSVTAVGRVYFISRMLLFKLDFKPGLY